MVKGFRRRGGLVVVLCLEMSWDRFFGVVIFGKVVDYGFFLVMMREIVRVWGGGERNGFFFRVLDREVKFFC